MSKSWFSGDFPNHAILHGLRVVECGSGISAAFATKLMADLGAEVIKVEDPSGDIVRWRGPFAPGEEPDPEKSGLFIYLNANKRGVTIDLTASGMKADFDRLLSSADILIHNFRPSDRLLRGLESEVLSKKFPSLITVGISPFGDRGPYKDWKGYALNIENAGGMAFLAPGASEYPDLPPLRAFGDQADYQGGLHACFAALAMYLNRLDDGAPSSIEISEQECIAAMLEMNLMHYTYTGRETSRLGKRVIGPWLLSECRDGHAFVACAEEPQWQRMVELMDDPEWTHEELFRDRIARGANSDALNLFMREWMSTWNKEELFHAGQAKRIPFAKVNTMKDIRDDIQLKYRNYFIALDYPGREIRVPSLPSRYGVDNSLTRRGAPRLGQDNAEVLRGRGTSATPEAPIRPRLSSTRLPLAGIRILDFTWAWAGPFATLQLAHLGAEVVRIESEKRVCITRAIPPFADDVPGPNRAGYFNQYNQGKRSITLNLADPAGLQVAYDLVPHCDVVVENFAGRVASKMGLGYEKLRQLRPDVIMLSMSGYGQDGPYCGYLGYGPPAAALSGFFFTTGYQGMPPMELGISYMDPNAGIFGAIAVINALIHRKMTGQGQYIDQSQLETAVQLMVEGLLQYQISGKEPERVGNHHPTMSPHNTYKSAGNADKWVSIAVGTEAEWRALCGVMGKPELVQDRRFSTLSARKQNENELDSIISEWTGSRDRWEVTDALQRAGVAAFPSMSNQDLATNEHLRERGYLVRLEHPEVGERTHVGIPWTLGGGLSRVASSAPLRGADTDAVLSKLLGYSTEKIDQLRKAGTLT
jgi:crotonobetainyl-CoA:carnitine CoA-transferase CaiB-like acyl-CoA transferase